MPVPESLNAAFHGLHSGARRVGDLRAVTTIVLGCILVTTATMLAFWPDRVPEQRRAVGKPAVSSSPKSETPNVASQSTAVPPTAVPPTAVPPTAVPPTAVPQTNAPASDVKVIGAALDIEKPCEEQTWPYIDRRCLTLAEDKPKKPAAPQPQPAARQPDPPDPQPVGSVTAIAPTPPVSTMAQGTVGTAATPINSATETAAATPRPSQQRSAPVPRTPPAAATDGTAGLTAREPQPQLAVAVSEQPKAQTAPSEATPAAPAMSRREQRRLTREQRQFEASQKRRAASDPNRIVRRWTEYTYNEPQGQSRRVIVIQRGSSRDNFFQTMR